MIRRALLATVAILLGLAAAEGLLRALDWPRFDACDTTAAYAVGDPELGFRGDPELPVAGVRPNALGLRGPLPETPKPPGELRLLFLGDSTCWGLGVALDESFGAQVAQQIGGDTSYLLGAFPSYSSYHSAVLLERLLPLSPDLVVLYVGARNDGDRARYYPDAQIPARRARLEAGWHQVRVLRLVEAAVDRLGMLLRRLRSDAAQARVPPAAFRENLEGMLARLEASDIPALVVVPAVSADFEAENPMAARYREILRQVAAERGVASLSLDRVVDGADTRPSPFFPDGFHLSVSGHRRAAEAIHAALVEEGLLSRSE